MELMIWLLQRYEILRDFSKLNKVLEERSIDLIVLAGFILKIPDGLVQKYEKKIINLHPSLLPKFGGKGMYGDNVHKAVLKYKERFTGITIHYVDENLDTGDILMEGNQPLSEVEEIYELRYHTTILATDMMLRTLELFKKKGGRIKGTKQTKLGEYYTAMSLEEKYLTEDIFNDYKLYDNE